ncbi:LuxR family transcriptional regulator [Streptomyces dioscori]|uniref:LuxR family transcriptional regulator n=1 Tax=Streptomyces dioscori TaxID=2109333 RepID=A0A2P8PU79_9ACTN|nr:LuxR family transcriptional regulator [Streptomyces dioscori]PSM37583.1 LuxR family transcriptional regulator [Streptomyces dioscori]
MRGRRHERDTLAALADAVETGRSAVLVLRGEAGIGKSALLDHLAARAAGHRVARGAGAESEMELPYAGLHQLCAPFLDLATRLPGPQRQALATAFGLSTGPPPDRFMVGLAVLGLLTDAAAEKPLFCLVDDAQWLDKVSAQTLSFVARRMLAEPLAMVFATREPSGRDDFANLPELTLQGLTNADARALLDSVPGNPADEQIRERILAEARGNPLALLELPQGRTNPGPTDALGLPGPGQVTGRIERSYLDRVCTLPADTRRLLLIAAAEPIGDLTLLRRATERVGIGPGALGPAVAAGLLDIGALVRFRHPLLRSAVYRSASLTDLRETHRVLAEVTDRALDPDRRAWHLARATVRPDEAIAADLEAAGGRAMSRGGAAAAAAFLAHAAVLTPQPRRKATRALAAAEAKLRAGAPTAARELLALAESTAADEHGRARAALLRAHIAFASSHAGPALTALLAAARRLVPLDVDLARETFLDALSAAMFAGRPASGTDVADVAAAARQTTTGATNEPRHVDLLLDALSSRFTDGYEAAVDASRAAVRELRRETRTEEVLRWSWPASVLAAEVWDDRAWSELSARHVRTARAVGALAELPLALNSRVVVHVCAGELEAAALLTTEIATIQAAADSSFTAYGTLTLAAWQGHDREAAELIRATMDGAADRGETGVGVAIAQRALAVLHNSLGMYAEALDAAREASRDPRNLVAANWALVELVEAAARLGRHEEAERAVAELTRITDAAGTDWALGVQARSRALLAQGAEAEALYREAVERLERTLVHSELARAHLVYGEWLRRENRRGDARHHLRTAHAMFGVFGAEAFTGHAVRELRATGETVASRAGAAPTSLTAQEKQIAQLARDGLTNSEIGAQLFLSPHTVEWHLRKVYAKLGITSRRQLHTAL